LVKAHRHYANAPITEGLIDIKVNLPSDIDLSSFDAFFERVKDKYPTRQDRKLFEGTFSTVPRVEAAAKETKIGYLFRSADGKRVLQARLDGFTFSRLKPYENWGALRDEAKRLWDTYREIVKPIQVTRVAVRYINQIDIPLPMRDFKDFFRTIPEVSPDLPQGLSGFLMQLQIPQEDISALLVITQTMLVPPPSPVVASVILDIDLFRDRIDFQSDDDVWNLLESFRDRKNQVFESCITDNARLLFGPET
jgi:uncharacterized protein (TIGR04255 family)